MWDTVTRRKNKTMDLADLSDIILPLPDFSSDSGSDDDDGSGNIYVEAGIPGAAAAAAAGARVEASLTRAIKNLRVGPGPSGLGVCLFSTAPIAKGDIVLEEAPLLLATPMSELPPLATFGPIEKDEGSAPMPSTAPEIGLDGWPTTSVFDNKHLGLVLAWMDAPEAVQLKVFEVMQHAIEPRGGGGRNPEAAATAAVAGGGSPTAAGEGAELSQPQPLPQQRLPAESAAATCCKMAADVLKSRGPPWLAEDWDAPPALLAEHEANVAGGGLLGALLRIFSVNVCHNRALH